MSGLGVLCHFFVTCRFLILELLISYEMAYMRLLRWPIKGLQFRYVLEANFLKGHPFLKTGGDALTNLAKFDPEKKTHHSHQKIIVSGISIISVIQNQGDERNQSLLSPEPKGYSS